MRHPKHASAEVGDLILPHATCDFLVIGGGVAGLRAAIGASDSGTVIVLNKGFAQASTSEFAQGGIAAALGEEEAELQSHVQDTLEAGCGLCRPAAVKVLVEEGPRRIRELMAWGAQFDKVGGRFALAQEGAHSHRRILRARGDATGVEIIKTLMRESRKRDTIHFYDGHFAVDLATRRIAGVPTCLGVWALDERLRKVRLFLARGVILATGGAGQVYCRTTNPPVATGDGIAMALRAGVDVEDMEFFQFHPTALSLPAAPSFLLSEAMRGEGAILRNADAKPFLKARHPAAELAPRDVVTRAILDEMTRGRSSHVLLDLTHRDAAFIRGRFPQIYATCLRYGIDITREAIPVAPSAHYLMGGVRSDLDGRTRLARLWAVGETACTGVHGANRLASNSLLEGLVFGARAAQQAGRLIPMASPASGVVARPPCFFPHRSEEDYLLVQKELRDVMWDDVGIIRSRVSLQRAQRRWKAWAWVVREPALTRLALETRNLLMTSAAIMAAALRREESIGAHFRADARGGKPTLRHFGFRQTALGRGVPSFSER